MSGAGKPGAVRGMAAALGAPVWARERLGPGEPGCICPKPLVKPRLPALLPSSALLKGTMASLLLPPMVNSYPHLTCPKGASNIIELHPTRNFLFLGHTADFPPTSLATLWFLCIFLTPSIEEPQDCPWISSPLTHSHGDLTQSWAFKFISLA